MSVKTAERRLSGFRSVPIEIVVRVGRCRTTLARIAEVKAGDQFLLDCAIGDPFDLLAEGRVIAHVEPIACEERVQVKVVSVASKEPDDGCP